MIPQEELQPKRIPENHYRLFNWRPIVAISLSFGLGIFLCYYLAYYALAAGALFAISGAVVVGFCLRKRSRGILSTGLTVLMLYVFFTLGCVSFAVRLADYERSEISEGEYRITATVREVTDQGLLLTNAAISNGTNVITLQKKIYVSCFSIPDNVAIGKTIVFEGEVKIYDVNDYGRFNAYNVLNRIGYFVTLPSEGVLTIGEAKPDFFDSARIRLRNVLFGHMDETTASFSYAMLTGDSSLIDNGILQNFRYGGIAHIFAVSGLHIGILFSVLYFLLKKVPIPWFVRCILIAGVLFLYVGICGFSPSSVRAFIMCTVLSVAMAGGSKYDRLNSVALASLVVLIVDPVYLFSIGFQLSVAAVFAISLLSAPVQRGLVRIRLPKKFSSALSVCLAAQLGTFPLLLEHFGYVSALSLVTNLLFIPLISTVYAVVFFAAIAACILPFAAGVLLYIPEVLLFASVFPIITFDFSLFLIGGFIFGGYKLLYYFILFVASDKPNVRVSHRAIVSCLLCVVLTVGVLAGNGAFTWRNNVVYVWSDYGGNLVYVHAEEDYVFSFGKPSESYYEKFALRYNLREIDGLFILGSATEINAAVPVMQKIIPAHTLYVGEHDAYLETFQSLRVVVPEDELSVGNIKIEFLTNNIVRFVLDGKSYLLAQNGKRDTPFSACKSDILIAEKYSELLSWRTSAKIEMYYEKEENKISLRRSGNLQMKAENGIIFLSESRRLYEVRTF